MLDVGHSAGLEKQERIAVVEIPARSAAAAAAAAAEVVAVGLGFCQFVCFEAVFEPGQEGVPVAADTELGY